MQLLYSTTSHYGVVRKINQGYLWTNMSKSFDAGVKIIRGITEIKEKAAINHSQCVQYRLSILFFDHVYHAGTFIIRVAFNVSKLLLNVEDEPLNVRN